MKVVSRRWVALVVALTLAIPLIGNAAEVTYGSFVDDEGSVHEADIEALAAAGITKGCNPPANDRYCPEDPVTREQMASFLVRALELPPGEAGQFVDDNNSIHQKDIEALATAGITKGCNPPTNDRYCPTDPVTREQMASFLVRALDLPDGPSGTLTDIDGSVHKADIEALAAAGITKGCNPPANDRFCPGDPVTRAQMASFLVRALATIEPVVPEPSVSGTLEIRWLALGQGDGALYVGACGEVGLIDAAAGEDDVILAELDKLGTRDLEWIIVSHYDSDNVGDVFEVATADGVTVGAVYDRGGGADANDTNSYADYYNWVTSVPGLRQPVEIGDQITLCDGKETVEFNVISVGTDGTAVGGLEVTSENDRSICLRNEFGDFDFATCGDVNGEDEGNHADVESAVAPIFGNVELARINKHGSDDSSNETYVNTLTPEAVILTVGQNTLGYPDPAVVARWKAVSTLYQTNSPVDNSPVDGNITVTTNGIDSFTVKTSASGKTDTFPLDEAS